MSDPWDLPDCFLEIDKIELTDHTIKCWSFRFLSQKPEYEFNFCCIKV